MQEIAQHFGGVVSPSKEREFGRANVQVITEALEGHRAIDVGNEYVSLILIF